MRVTENKGEFMKKIIIIAALLLLSVSLTGCDMIKKYLPIKNISASDRSDLEIKEDNGANIYFVASTPTSLTVKIENKTDSTWQSGNMRDYLLEVEKDGEWYAVKQIGEFANTMELMIFAPGETLTHTFEFEARYGTLTAGKYRVVKSWWANKTANEDAHEFHLVCEFTVE